MSAAIGVIGFIFTRWVAPRLPLENVILKTFAQAAPSLSWFILFLFIVFAGLSWVLSRKKRSLLETQESVASLQALPWQHFEWMVGEAYRRQGYAVDDSLDAGPDGGIDLVLRKDGQTTLVQCKRWRTQSVGAPIVRELFGLLNHHGAARAIVVTCGHFTREAAAFADGKPIDLIDGPALLQLVKDVQAVKPSALETPPTPINSDFSPTRAARGQTERPCCPTCGAAMVLRTAKRGANLGLSFWGCSTYPKCRGVREA